MSAVRLTLLWTQWQPGPQLVNGAILPGVQGKTAREATQQGDSDSGSSHFLALFPFGFSFPSSSSAVHFPSSPWLFHSSPLAARDIALALQRTLGDTEKRVPKTSVTVHVLFKNLEKGSKHYIDGTLRMNTGSPSCLFPSNLAEGLGSNVFSPAAGPGHPLPTTLRAFSPSHLARSLPCAFCGWGPPIRSCSPLPGQMHVLPILTAILPPMPFLTFIGKKERNQLVPLSCLWLASPWSRKRGKPHIVHSLRLWLGGPVTSC